MTSRVKKRLTLLVAAVVLLTGGVAGAYAIKQAHTRTRMAVWLREGMEAYKAGDYTRAAARFKPFAEAGNAKAQVRMGELYAKGLGVPQNNFQAYIWFSAAASSGNEEAKTQKERVDPLLQPAEKQQAEKLAERLSRPVRGR